jgi:biopolymer transport protein ExbD
MRYLLLIILLPVLSCAQQTNRPGNPVDTLKLFDPRQDPRPAGAAEMEVFFNSIALMDPNGFTIRENDKIYVCGGWKELEDSLTRNAAHISKRKFYIWKDNNTSFQRIVSLIDLLKKVGIDNYKVLDFDKSFTPPEPVTITMPESVTTTTLVEDSTYFLIHISDKSIGVTLSGNSTSFKNADELDKFISANIEGIGTRRILIKASKGLPYKKFEPVVNVLKKHNILKYNLVSE